MVVVPGLDTAEMEVTGATDMVTSATAEAVDLVVAAPAVDSVVAVPVVDSAVAVLAADSAAGFILALAEVFLPALDLVPVVSIPVPVEASPDNRLRLALVSTTRA